MKGVIIAAGEGTRLRAMSDSKPLAELAGVPLIEHVVRRAAVAGIDGFVVATGHEAERVETFLAGLAERFGVPIECVRVADWRQPNGHSVIAAAARVTGNYALMMTDHLFDPAMLNQLLATGDEAKLLLAVDTRLDAEFIDLEDATRVRLGPQGRIARIGKLIEPFDAVDTGLFRATPALAPAIAAAVAAGSAGSLSEGVQRLADQGLAKAVVCESGWWIDVDEPRAFSLAESYLT